MSDQPHQGATHPVAQLCRRFADRLDELVDPGSLTLWSASNQDVAEVVQAAEHGGAVAAVMAGAANRLKVGGVSAINGGQTPRHAPFWTNRHSCDPCCGAGNLGRVARCS